MKMPGFTAEASLHKTSEIYHAAIEGVHAIGAVSAAFFSMFTRIPQLEAHHFSVGVEVPRCEWECFDFDLDPVGDPGGAQRSWCRFRCR